MKIEKDLRQKLMIGNEDFFFLNFKHKKCTKKFLLYFYYNLILPK